MNGLTREVLAIASSTNLSGSARVTNFNPDSIFFTVRGEEALKKEDLAKIIVNIQFKNSKGSNLVVCNAVPLSMIYNLSDMKNGFGLLGDDSTGCAVLDLGKYILKADDDITVNISTNGTLSQALSLYCFVADRFIGKERMLSYKYIDATITQAYQEAGVIEVYGQYENPSASAFVQVSDFFGTTSISELASASMGASLYSAEDFDNFGKVFEDVTGMGQPVSVTAGSSAEDFLFVIWNVDTNRIGFVNTQIADAQNLAKSYRDSDPNRWKYLAYYFEG